MKNLKLRLTGGETLLGCWLNLGSLVTAEIVGLAGFDWVLIDLEHGAGSGKDALKATINAAGKAGKSTGILLSDPDDFQLYHDMGIRMIACGADAAFVANGARGMVEKLTEQRSKIINP